MEEIKPTSPVSAPTTTPTPSDATPVATGAVASTTSYGAAPSASPVSEAVPEREKIDIDQFLKVELRVARIESAESLPKSKKLLRLQLDVGALGKRQILAGVAQFYTPEALIGRHIVIVANLKPAMLMGVQSEGMLLAASTAELSQLIILDPGQTMPPGSLVR